MPEARSRPALAERAPAAVLRARRALLGARVRHRARGATLAALLAAVACVAGAPATGASARAGQPARPATGSRSRVRRGARRGGHGASHVKHGARHVSRGARSHSATAAALANLRLIDYFPASDGWGNMWWRWDPAQMEVDFARIAALHANGVRIIVSAPAFGFPKVNATMAARLAQTLAMAAADGLRVELTLFNEWQQYGEVTQSEEWARELIAPFRGDQEIAYIDLHNELPANDDAAALSWAQALVPFVKGIDGGIPVTVSSSISSGLAPLEALVKGLGADQPDLYDVHYYGDPADAYAVLAAAKQLVGQVPLYVGETGFATSPAYGWADGLVPSAGSLESYQDYYFRMVDLAAQALGLALPAPWILYDMPGQGTTQWGHHMGILHSDGAPKPAATTLATIFAGGAVPLSFNNGFEQGSDGLPWLWRRWLPDEARFALDTTVAHSGTASARIEDSTGNHTVGCPAFYIAPVAVVTPGVTYSAGAWLRSRRAAGISRVVLVWSEADGHYLSSSESPSLPPGNNEWTHLTVSASPPAGAAAVEIDLQVCENPGATWFDDVSFTPAG